MLEPDRFLLYHFSAATRNFTSGKSDVYVGLLAAAARSAFNKVLLTEPVSRRNTFVGGTCAPPSALLVNIEKNCIRGTQKESKKVKKRKHIKVSDHYTQMLNQSKHIVMCEVIRRHAQ